MTDGAWAVEAEGLSRSFGDAWAVWDLHLRIPVGSFYGVLGPNGAGKTTTLRMMTGLLRPTSGLVKVLGASVWADPNVAKANAGVLPDSEQLFDRLSGAELIEFHGLLRGMDRTTLHDRSTELLEVLDLTGQQSDLVVDYSHGMRKKIGLATALVHNPRVLFLDEPFEAIDPVSARTIRGVLQRYTAAGGTVVFSSHVLTVVEQVCTHVAIIDKGRIVADAPLEELAKGGDLEDVFAAAVGAVDSDGTALSWLGSSSG